MNASIQLGHEWKYFASSEGSYIEQEIYTTTPSFTVTARKNGETRSRTFTGVPGTGGWEIAEAAGMVEAAERIAAEAVEFCTAKPVDMGMKDLILTPSHAMLTIHEIVAHATELDRIMGYEANYAGTSFVKVSDLGKLKYGSKLFNVTADRTIPTGVATIGYDDDGVKTQEWPIVRDGILVGLQTNRESAHFIGEKESRGCTSANSWRDYPFLRMPNVHVDAGPKGSPTPEEMIADTKDGVMIDGRGSYSIDQQRYNGQFGGNAFWEIKNGKTHAHGDQRHLQRDHDRLLGQPRRHLRQGALADVRHRRRREGPADADQQHLARLAVAAHPQDHGRRRVRVSETQWSRPTLQARPPVLPAAFFFLGRRNHNGGFQLRGST